MSTPSCLARAIYSTIRTIPSAMNGRATDSDLAAIALELQRASKELYAQLDNRRHRRWTAAAHGRGAS
jgi:hypothetical protein